MSSDGSPQKVVVAIATAALLLTVLLAVSAGVTGNVLTIDYLPAFPIHGEPVVAIITLRDVHPEPHRFELSVYTDGVKTMDSVIEVSQGSPKEYKIVANVGDLIGTSWRIYANASDLDAGVRYERSAMIPPYPPEIFSSFVSFASFSSTMMGYMTTLTYYMQTVTPADSSSNIGLAIALSLIALLVFIELSDPAYGGVGDKLLELRRRYGGEAAALFVIFALIVFTKVVFIISGVA